MSFKDWDNDCWNVTTIDTNHMILHAPNIRYVFNQHDFKEFQKRVNNPIIIQDDKVEISVALLEEIRHHLSSLTGLKIFDGNSDNVRYFIPPVNTHDYVCDPRVVTVPVEELIPLTFNDVIKKIDEVLK